MAQGTRSDERDDLVIYHPNRDKATSKATKGIVTVLLLASAGLVAIITFGGWSNLQGDQPVSIAYVIIYCVMAFFVATRWSRGMLPLAAALAILLLVFAAIATPGWFDRDHIGYDNPGLPPALLGLLTVVVIPVQLLLIAFAMRGFSQEWNIEIEMSRAEMERRHRGAGPGGPYQPQPQA